jgi:hypothetical protein
MIVRAIVQISDRDKMHDVLCMRCGEETDWLYYSKNPDWEGWEMCAWCLRECNAAIKDKKEEQPVKNEKKSEHQT